MMNALLSNTLSPFVSTQRVEAIGWTLVHSLWQFAAVAVVALVLDRLLRRSAATTRYAVLLAAMLLIVAAPAATWSMLLWGRLADGKATLPHDIAAASPAAADFVAEAPLGDAQFSADGLSPVDTSPSGQEPVPVMVVGSSAMDSVKPASWRTRLVVMIEPWMGAIVTIWCCGVLLFSVRPVWSWLHVRRLRTVGVSPVADQLEQAMQRARRRLNMVCQVRVLQSTLVPAPVVIGCFRCVILLPASFIAGTPVSQLEAILAHELAHVRRYDYAVNLLQTLVETLFFYHPAVWWLSHRIRVERENCCDDLAVAALGNKVEYGRALLAVEEFRGAASSLALSARGGSPLLIRIRRLFVGHTEDVRGGPGVPALGVLIAGVVTALVWNAVAAGPNEHPADGTAISEAPFVARVNDRLAVELLAVLPHEADAGAAWRPNGRPFENPPTLPAFHGGAGAIADGALDCVLKFTGVAEGQRISVRMPGLRFMPYPDTEGLTRIIAEPSETAGKSVSLRVGIADSDWGPFQRVDRRGKLSGSVDIPAACRDIYAQIKPDHIEPRVNSCLFCWADLQSLDDRGQWQVVAVDKDGKRHDPYGQTVWSSDDGYFCAEVFNLPLEDIDYFEYRLRPYRHWVTFENVSLAAGLETTVRFRTVSRPIPPESAFRLPDHWIVEDVRLVNDDQEIVTVSVQGGVNVRRWDVAGRKLISEIKLASDQHGRSLRQNTLQLSADARRVIAATDEYVGIWDAATGELLKTLPIPKKEWEYDSVRCLACSSDFSVIVAGLGTSYDRTTLVYDGYGIVWDAASGEMINFFTHDHGYYFQDIALSPDGKRFATCNKHGGEVCIWETSTGKLLRDFSNELADWKSPDPQLIKNNLVNAVAFSPDGKLLAISGSFGVKLLDSESGGFQRQIDSPYRFHSQTGIAFSPDGRRLARWGARGRENRYTVPVWSTESGEQLFELSTPANVADFSRDGQILAIGESDFYAALSVWPLSGEMDQSLAAPKAYSRIDRVEENTHHRGPKAAALADKWVAQWGQAQHGIQYGVALTAPNSKFRMGERVTMAAFLRNASHRPLQFDLRPDMFGNLPQITSVEGTDIDLQSRPLLGKIAHYRDTLQPGEVFGPLYLNFGLGANPHPGRQGWAPFWKAPKAGAYKLQHTVSFKVAGPNASRDATSSDWSDGKLTSGELKFEVIDGPGANYKRPASDPDDDAREAPRRPSDRARIPLQSSNR